MLVLRRKLINDLVSHGTLKNPLRSTNPQIFLSAAPEASLSAQLERVKKQHKSSVLVYAAGDKEVYFSTVYYISTSQLHKWVTGTYIHAVALDQFKPGWCQHPGYASALCKKQIFTKPSLVLRHEILEHMLRIMHQDQLS